MKVNVSLFGDEKKQIQDQELYRSKDFALQTITMWMRLCAVKRVQVDQTRSTGVSILSNLSWKGMDELIPEIIKQIRSYILLNIIKLLMDIFGVHLVEIELDNNELQEQRKYWGFITKGDDNTKNSSIPNSNMELKTVPLNIEKDPTNKPINIQNNNG